MLSIYHVWKKINQKIHLSCLTTPLQLYPKCNMYRVSIGKKEKNNYNTFVIDQKGCWCVTKANLKSAFIQHFIVAILVYCSVLSNIYYWKVPFFTTKIFNLVAAKSQVHTKGKYEYVTKTLAKDISATHLSSLTVTSGTWSIHCYFVWEKNELFHFQVVNT